MSEIKRYDFVVLYKFGDPQSEIQQTEAGDYVLYSDHAAEVERLNQENADLRLDIEDIDSAHREVMEERCPTDEIHCTCVPKLRSEVERLNQENAAQKLFIVGLENKLAAKDADVERLMAAVNQLIKSSKQDCVDTEEQIHARDVEIAALVKALDEATAEKSFTFCPMNIGHMPKAQHIICSICGSLMARTEEKRDYSSLSPASRTLCEKLEKEGWK